MNYLIAYLMLVAIVSAMTVFASTVIREEDRERERRGELAIATHNRTFIVSGWVMLALLVLLSVVLADVEKGPEIMILLAFVVEVMLFLASLWKRKSYYTASEECFSYIHKGELKYSIKWEDIDHVRKRIVYAGKTAIVYLDVVMRNGEVIKSLPSFTDKLLEGRANIRQPNYKLMLIIVGAFVALSLLALIIIK